MKYIKNIFQLFVILVTAGLLTGCGKNSPENPDTQDSNKPTDPEEPNIETSYKVGDCYKKGFVSGIVVYVDETGKHGSVISLDETIAVWSYKHEEPMGSIPSISGRKNTDAVYAMTGWRENYPGFLWCSNMDVMSLKLWYIPSCSELTRIYNAYTKHSTQFNDILIENGGKPIADAIYWTSDELSKSMANAFDMRTGNMIEEPNLLDKGKEYRFRAMSDF